MFQDPPWALYQVRGNSISLPSAVRWLGESPGLRPEDVFVSLVEVAKENWSLGNGLAQYA